MSEKQKRQWILHKEQTPEDGQEVFYFFDVCGVFKGKYQHPHCYYGKHGFLICDVTHWMPYDGGELPEAPTN